MTDHPITPPPELVGEWLCSEDYLSDASTFSSMTITSSRLQSVASQAARWGADQELQACCAWLKRQRWESLAMHLRDTRRPKPSSLVEQALLAIEEEQADVALVNYKVIRAALERLQELENQ